MACDGGRSLVQGHLEGRRKLGRRMHVATLIALGAGLVVCSKTVARIDGSGPGVGVLMLVQLICGALDVNGKICCYSPS